MADRPLDLADVLGGGLGEKWRRDSGRLSRFLNSVGLTGGEHSRSLYIFPVQTSNPAHRLEELSVHIDPDEQWITLAGHREPHKTPLLLAFPVSIKFRGGQSQQAFRKNHLALFIEVHSRLVTWWLVNSWRSKQLAEATWELSNSMQVIPGAACARSLLETAASVWVDTTRLREVWSKRRSIVR